MKTEMLKLDSNERTVGYEADLIRSIVDRAILSDQSLNRYPDQSATKLKKAYSKFSNIPFENLVAGNGSDELLDLIFSVYAQGKTVVCFNPDFSMYDIYAKKYNANLIKVNTMESSTMKLEDLIDIARKSNASMIVFSNPNNPTGKAFTKSEIVKLAKDFSGTVVVDEAYIEFCNQDIVKEIDSEFYNQRVADCIQKLDNLIVTRTCSKAVGLAGIRVGFMASSIANVKKIEAVRSPYNVNTLSQEIASEILSYPEYINKCIEDIIIARDDLYSKITCLIERNDEYRADKSYANFIFIKTGYAKQLYTQMRDKGILVRMFDYGVRITVGTIEDNDKILSAMFSTIKYQQNMQGGLHGERAV